MTRGAQSSRGAPFGWDTLHFTHPDRGYPGTNLRIANLHLPDSTADATLGAADLEAGEVYDLLVETEGVTIRWTVAMPGQVEARIEPDGVLRWNRVEGAVGYRVIVASLMELTTDTVFRLTQDELEQPWAPRPYARVQALERNAWSYFSDPELGRAGIDTGFGVFGGLTESRVEW